MTTNEENVHLILYEFKLQYIECPDDKISSSDYGNHLVKSLGDIFECTFKSIVVTGYRKVKTEILEANNGDILLTMRMYDRRDIGKEMLITISIEVMSKLDMNQKNLMLQQFSDRERKRLSQEKDCDNQQLAPDEECVGYLPMIQRGVDYSPYYKTSDDRFCHYNIKEVLYDVRSKYQHIFICDTVDTGKLLVLDGLANLSEADTIAYTHTLMDLPKEMANYAGSNVLILGGGDGGVLKELLTLENPPNHVTMVELDEAVMTGCSKYMRSVCGKFLDEQYRLGSNYQVICGDAIQFMEKAKARNECFDFIIGDLTDVPVSSVSDESSRDTWNFLKYVLELSVKLIKPNTGKYLTHFNGKSVPKLIYEYEQMLEKLSVPTDRALKCTFSRSECFVPSFQEVWIFYQIEMQHNG